nr:putative phage abortive infection protein [Amylibacter sp.]
MASVRTVSGTVIAIAAILAILLWVANFAIALYLSGEGTFIGDRGTFGDVFGAVNSIFTGMAFIGVVYSIAMQREELAVARSEMKQTKEILAAQQKNITEQNLATKKQVFEVTFFQLFTSFVELTNSIDIEGDEGKTVNGKDAIDFLFKSLQLRFAKLKDSDLIVEDQDSSRLFDSAYDHFFHDVGHELAHYFRTLYTLLNFVENSRIDDKVFYIKLVRAQLSDTEAALLLCNYLSKYTTERFNMIVEKYGLLKNVDPGHLIVTEVRHRVLSSAFGRTANCGTID